MTEACTNNSFKRSRLGDTIKGTSALIPLFVRHADRWKTPGSVSYESRKQFQRRMHETQEHTRFRPSYG